VDCAVSGLAANELPLICVAGTARERGRQHGELLHDRIALAVDRYMERFRYFAQLDRAAARLTARRFVDPIRAYDAEILEEIVGIAEGAELPFEDVLAMNCRSELMFGKNMAAECTAFGLQPSVTADGHTYVGQNWDWAPDAAETIAIVVIRQEPEAPDILLLDESGVVGRLGLNSAGIGLVTNTILAKQGLPDGVPYNVLLRGVLNARRLDDAMGALIRSPRAISSNHLIGDAGGQTINVEVAPDQFDVTGPVDGIVTHGNHFAGLRMQVHDLGVERWPDSLYRVCRLRDALAAHAPAIEREDMMEALRDTFGAPNAISRRADPAQPPLEQVGTVASIVVDCDEQTCWIANGAPDEAAFVEYRLRDLPVGTATSAGHSAAAAAAGAGVSDGGSVSQRGGEAR
jgi:isopenicillin-N N-acyltransferase-like protein